MDRGVLMVVAIGGLVVAGACSGTLSPAPPSSSGIQGQVVIWPSCPAEPGDAGCAPRPFAARVVVSGPSGQRITATDTRDGWFRLALPAGAYVVEAQAEGVMCAPIEVAVPRDGYVLVEVRCDTGVR